jgi:hypothetical protein
VAKEEAIVVKTEAAEAAVVVATRTLLPARVPVPHHRSNAYHIEKLVKYDSSHHGPNVELQRMASSTASITTDRSLQQIDPSDHIAHCSRIL